MDSLVAGISQQLENSLWKAVRTLQDKALIHRRRANSGAAHKHPEIRAQMELLAQKADADAAEILKLLARG